MVERPVQGQSIPRGNQETRDRHEWRELTVPSRVGAGRRHESSRGRAVRSVGVANVAGGPAAVTITATLATDRGKPLATARKTLSLGAGERKTDAFDELAAPPGKISRLILDAVDGAGAVLYHHEIPVRPGYASDRTTAIPDVYFSGSHKEGPQFRDVMMSPYNPIQELVIGRIRIGNLPGKETAARAELTLRRPGEDKPFFRAPLPPFDDAGTSEAAASVRLKPGLYEVGASVYAADDAPLRRSRQYFIRYDHEKELPWLGNTIGVSNRVLQPWTPLEAARKDDELELRCWGRMHAVAGSALPVKIISLDEELLAGPVRLEIMAGGKPLSVEPSEKPNFKAAPHEVNYSGRLAADGWRIDVRGLMEYDGYMLNYVSLKPRGKRAVDRIRLVIPLRPSQATHLHATADDMRSAVSSMALGAQQGQLWHSGQSRDPNYNGRNLTVGNFKPFVWVGNVGRGLAFMADNDRGWVPDDTKAVPAIEVVRDATAVNLILNLVARPVTFTADREICFSLQATPVRPLPDDFRLRKDRTANNLAFVGFNEDSKAWDGTALSHPVQTGIGPAYPVDWEKNRAFTKRVRTVDKLVATPYQAINSWLSVSEIDDPLVPGLHGANHYGYLCPETTASLMWGDGVIARTEMEYRLWRYQRWIKESPLEGFYFDNAYPTLGTNVAAGQGYIIDLPDRPTLHGKIQPGYQCTVLREFLKRLRTIFAEEGVGQPYVTLHATDTFVINAYAFADLLLDGETHWTRDDRTFAESFPAEMLQALYPSQKWGLTIMFLMSPHTRSRDLPNNEANKRGYLMLHDIDGWEAHFWGGGGLDRERYAQFLPYWDQKTAAAIKTDQPGALVSAWRQGNNLIVLAFNHTRQDMPALPLSIDLATLGIPPHKPSRRRCSTRRPRTARSRSAGTAPR